MNIYKAQFLIMGAYLVLEIQHDDKAESSIEDVCEEIAQRLNLNFMSVECVA